MFQKISKSAAKKLNQISDPTLLTVHVPLEKGMKGHKFNQSQLHNLRSELKKTLSTKQHKQVSSEIELILEKLGYVNESEGIAMFYDGENISSYALNFVPEKSIEIGTKYNLEQINNYYKQNKFYYVLAISKNGSKLYKGDMENLEIVQVEGLGKDLQTTLNIDEVFANNLQNHPAGNGGKNNVGFHGHGGYKDIKKTLFDDYLRTVDKKILQVIKDKTIPLILVAVDYGQSAYKHISKYPSIFIKGVSTNPDELSPIELHKKTFPLLSGI
jgi:hypothetical protein